VPGAGRKVKSIEKLRRALAVIPGERGWKVDVQQLKGRWHVHRSKITKPQ
jgi:hypothetical protein